MAASAGATWRTLRRFGAFRDFAERRGEAGHLEDEARPFPAELHSWQRKLGVRLGAAQLEARRAALELWLTGVLADLTREITQDRTSYRRKLPDKLRAPLRELLGLPPLAGAEVVPRGASLAPLFRPSAEGRVAAQVEAGRPRPSLGFEVAAAADSAGGGGGAAAPPPPMPARAPPAAVPARARAPPRARAAAAARARRRRCPRARRARSQPRCRSRTFTSTCHCTTARRSSSRTRAASCSAALHGPSATSAARARRRPCRPRAVAPWRRCRAYRRGASAVAEVPQFPPARTAAVPRMPTRKHNKVPGF